MWILAQGSVGTFHEKVELQAPLVESAGTVCMLQRSAQYHRLF